ncbi:ESPR-type extended signal peptide-containing protein [Dialister invisus]|uniref:ESPR-type extended signal peptide-containing protein n=2 Tax=Dialister invisus TaxID=218538 RepID=UPI003990E1D9
MNQIYKVIWSRVKHCYVVVSEVAGRCGKNGGAASEKESLPIRAFLCALALTGCLMPGVAEANTQYGPGASATGGDSVAVGDSAKATAGHATAVGTLTEADGVNSFVAGLQAKSGATAENSVAIGRGAQALGQKRASDQFTASTIAIGNNATATENGDIVIGRKATSTVSKYHGEDGSGAVVMGSEAHSYGSRGDVVLGSGAEANIIRKGTTDPAATPSYSQSIAIGSMAKVYGTQAMAIGGDVKSIGHSSIAIGGNDVDLVKSDLQAAVPGFWAAGAQNKFERETAALYPGTTLGNATLGTSQYRSNTASIGAASIAMGAMTQSFGIGSTAIGVNSMSKGAASTSIGVIARSWGKNSLAIGSQAGAYGDKSTSLGDTNMVGFDMTDGTTSGAASSAIGTDNKVYGNNSYAIGGGNTIGSATITETTEANSDKIKKVTAGTVKGSTAGAFGYKNTVTTDNAYVVGNNSTASADGAMVLGSSASVTGKNGVALGNNTKVANENAVAIGNGSETAAAVATPSATINGVAHNFAGVNPASTVSVGKAGAERTITNVAAGRISATSTDAINGSQLYAVTSEVDKGVAYAGDVKDAAAAANKFTRKLGEQTNIIGGVTDTSKLTDGNIGVVSNGTDTLNIKLAKDVKVDSVTAGNTVINNNGLTVGGNTYVTNNGINANNAPITNVASGGTTDSNAANIGDVKKAAAGAKATVTGDKQATVTNTTAADGHVDYVVSATKTTLAAEAGGKVSVTGGTEDANGVIAYTVGLDAATKTAINNIGGGTIAAGDNKTVTGDTVNTYLNNNYYDKPTMDTKLGDKANTNMDNITNAGKTVINDIAADAVKVVNGKNTTVTPGTEAGANGTVKTYAVNVSGDLTGITSISNQKTAPGGTTTGAKITLGDTTNTVDVGGAKITNVADGDVAPNSKDAVNGGQLNEVKELAGKHTTIKAKDANVTVTEGTNGDGGKEFTVGLGNVVTVGQTHPVTVNGDAGTVNGLTNTTWDIDNPQPVSGQAATEDQLKTVSDGVKTNKTNITKNANDITNINTTIGKGLNFKGDDATVINKKLGEQLDIKGGADASKLSDGNIGVVSGNGALNIKLAKDVKVDSVTTGNTVINNNGLTVGGKTYVTNNGINANNQKVTNVADGQVAAGSKDAVNGGQLHDAKNEVINKGLRFNADNNSEKTNKLGSKVTVNGDSNITTEITQTGDDTKIGVKLNQDINVKTVTAADTVKAGGVTMGGQTVANAAGANETGNYVTGLDNKTWNIQNPNIVSGRGATEDQLKIVSDEVKKQGANATDYRLVKNASNVDGAYTVDTNGDIDLTVEDKNHAGQKETVKLKDIASKSKLDDVIAKGLQFDANAGGTKTNKLGSKITVKGEGTAADTEYSGENLKTFITQDPAGNTTIDVKMNKNLKVETIVATGENGKDGKIGINGKDGVTTNISVTRDGKPGVDGAPGTTTTRIVYEKPDGTKEEVATLNDGMKYGGDTGAVIKKKLNEQVNVVGGIRDESKLTDDDNIGVVSDGNDKLKVRLAKALKGLESVTTGDTVMNNSGVTINNGAAGNPVSLTKNGLDNGGNKIINVAAGDVSANSTDAVNGSQLHDVKTLAGKHTVVKVDGQENRTDGNLLITKTDNNGQATYNLKLNDELTVGKTGAAGKSGSIGVKGKDGSAVAINGKDGSIGLNGANGANGLTMKSGDAKPAVDGTNVTRLVLEENGKKHDVATLDDGMKYGGDTGAVIKKKLNEQVNVVGGITDESKLTTEDNLGVVSDGNNNLKVRLAKALKGLESITAGDTFINNNGITISNGAAGNTVSLTKNGLDNGGNKITNVADGVDGTDAVNVSQLKSQGSDIINKGFGIKAEDGNEVKKKLGETVDVVGDGKNISTRVEGGRVRVGLKDDILLNSVATGRTRMDTDGLTVQDGSGNTAVTVDKDGLKIKDGPSVTKSGIDAGGKKITNVAAGEADTDAVNVSQLKKAAASATTKVADGKNTTVTSETNADGSKTYHVNLNDDITLGSDPSKQISIKGTEGTIKAGQVTVNGTAGTVNGLTNKTWDPNNITSGQAATEDQLKVVSGQAGKHSSVTAGSNIFVTTGTNANGGTEYKVAVVDTPTFKTITAGNTVMNSSGLTIKNGPSITQTGVDAGGKRITNVAAGDISPNSTDAVNGGQLWKTNQTINNIGGAVNELGDRMDRVGAGAAALAALHPLDFDPDDKWDVAAGYGNYKDAHAVAVGAFYRPNEDTMFSVGGSFGGGENMVNAGVSVKLGQGNHVSTSKVAMAKEIVDLRDENKDLKKRLDTMEQKMNSILGILDMGKKKDFPDVPENHWAYEYVATLAGNGILEGYPDGMFSGERSMTRYEFAAMFYRALKNGAPVDDNMDRAMNEFEPELRQIRLDRIRVDRISGKDNDRNKVERVRVNSEDDKANNDYRDVYGSHISPKA